MEGECLAEGTCTSGTCDPALCSQSTVQAACPTPPEQQPPYLQWSCIGFLSRVQEPPMPVGTRCKLRCDSWLSSSLEPGYLESTCQENGEWSETYANDGKKSLHFPIGPYPKPDTHISSLSPGDAPPLTCTCAPLQFTWPPFPHNFTSSSLLKHVALYTKKWVDSLPAGVRGDFTGLSYNPNDERGATFLCDQQIIGAGTFGITELQPNGSCNLYCDGHLTASVACEGTTWTGKPELGFFCYKKPKIDANWSVWGHWSFNSSFGTKERQRTCDNPPAANG